MTKDCYSIAEFCESHGFSESFFYKLQTQGRAPRVMKVGRRTLISAEAAAEWRRKMENSAAVEPHNILAAG